jgi:membrane protease subunit (stomatin/prohibitin family)
MDKEIKRGAQLIVRESQMAQFIYQDQFGDIYGPGTHTLTTNNISILSTLKGWKYGFDSPFKADVYFVNARLFTGNGWGIPNPIMMRDADFGMVRVGAYGTYDFHILDPRLFLREVVGAQWHYSMFVGKLVLNRASRRNPEPWMRRPARPCGLQFPEAKTERAAPKLVRPGSIHRRNR